MSTNPFCEPTRTGYRNRTARRTPAWTHSRTMCVTGCASLEPRPPEDTVKVRSALGGRGGSSTADPEGTHREVRL